MADQPNIPQKAPYVMEVEPGTYFWCSCGQSSNQPFCDGSHKGSSFTPEKMVVEKPRKVAFCGCKHTSNSPLCDGSHNKL